MTNTPDTAASDKTPATAPTKPPAAATFDDVFDTLKVAPAVVKPGWQTTEFWGSWAAKIFGALLTSGLLADGSMAMRITGAAVFVLAQLGYTWSRTAVKTAAMLLVVGLFLPAQMACGAASSAGKTVAADVVDCTSADRAKLEAQFGPAVEQAIQRATGADGKIDLPSLAQLSSAIETDGWCVVEKVAAQLIAAVVSRAPGTASAAAPLDPADLAAKISALRVQKFGATRFQLGGS